MEFSFVKNNSESKSKGKYKVHCGCEPKRKSSLWRSVDVTVSGEVQAGGPVRTAHVRH